MNMHTEQKVLSFPEARKAVDTAAIADQAQACLESGDVEGESKALVALLELEPENVAALINLGTARYNQRSYSEALELYQRAIAVDPRHPLAQFNAGNTFEELGRYAEAVEAYSHATRLDPRYADAHYNLALAYHRVGEKRKAIPHWSRYMRLDPSSIWTEHARKELRRALQADPLQLVG
jgi:tetratricopeptide (TPR) repeat protein